MTAIKRIQKGDEIFNDYGALPRPDLLRRYGYITDEYKKWDVVDLRTNKLAEIVMQDTGVASNDAKRRVSCPNVSEMALVDVGNLGRAGSGLGLVGRDLRHQTSGGERKAPQRWV